jgi:putative oxidoreductase
MFKSLAKYADLGLLLGRIGIGATYIYFGWQKLAGGQAVWTKIGHAMGNIGIHFMPNFWGLLAALSEFGGGILLILGFVFRPATAFLAFTMLIAFVSTFRAEPHGFQHFSWPFQMLCTFVMLLFVGPGKYSIDRG